MHETYFAPATMFGKKVRQILFCKQEVFETVPICAENGQVNDVFYDPNLHDHSKAALNKEEPVNISKLSVHKNTVVLAIVFLLLYTAYKCLANLQSSINPLLGTMSLSVLYCTDILSCLFLSSLVISFFGLKHTTTISIILFTFYFLANFQDEWYTLVPASALVGIAVGPLWTAKGAYLTILAGHYAEKVNQPLETCIGMVMGGFNYIFLTHQIWGNIASYYVLKPEETTSEFNGTSDLGMCGAAFCNHWTNESNLEVKPSQQKLYTFYGICTALPFLAALLIIFMLDPLEPRKTNNQRHFMETIVATLKHTLNPYQILLIPITVYSGMEQAYITGDFTKAFVSCGWGVHEIGLVLIFFGLATVLFTVIVVQMLKIFRRLVVLILGASINGTMIWLMFWWHPTKDSHVLYFVIVVLWGMGEAIWQTPIYAIYGFLFFDDKVEAFAHLRLWKSLGFMIAFAYSSFLCVTVKLALLSGCLVVGMGAYLAIEIHLYVSKKKTRNSQCNEQTQETTIK